MSRSKPQLWLGAFTGFYRPDGRDLQSLDAVSRFLYAARSVIPVISAQAAIIAGLLAAAVGRFQWISFIGVLSGFVVAHMISNLSNDYFGFERGHDTPDSRHTRTLLVGLAILAVAGAGVMRASSLNRAG